MSDMMVALPEVRQQNIGATATEIFQESPPVAFANQGLDKVCSMVSFAEFLRLRQVCRAWRRTVHAHTRLQTVQILLDQNWEKDGGFIDPRSPIQWTAVHFRFFRFNSTTRFSRAWDTVAAGVTKLTLENIRVPCNELVDFLKTCPSLQDLKLHNNLFPSIVLKDQTVIDDTRRTRRVDLNVHCVHTRWLPEAGEIPIPPAIHTLFLLRCNYFPVCLLDYIATRCRGTLRHLKIRDARKNHKRYAYLPSYQAIEDRYFKIFTESSHTLETFDMTQVYRGDKLLTRLFNADTAIIGGVDTRGQLGTNLREIILEQCYAWSTAQDLAVTHAFTRFIDQFGGPQIQVLRLRVVHLLQMENLRAALLRVPNAHTLMIRVNWARDTIDIVPILGAMPNLVDLHIKDRRRVQAAYILPNYAFAIPPTVRFLEWSQRHMPQENYLAIINSPLGVGISKLFIGFGRLLNDDMMQTIIRNFPNLRELEISDSRKLTDVGLTGLTEATCKALVNCASYRMMIERTPKPEGRCISELVFLQRLSFDGCRKISDVTALVAIRFPHLRHLNLSRCLHVTDIGIANLHTHNPGLEGLTIRKNKKTSHFGVNELLKNCPTILNIHIDRTVLKRKLGHVKYEQHPSFNRIVTVARWDEKIKYRNL